MHAASTVSITKEVKVTFASRAIDVEVEDEDCVALEVLKSDEETGGHTNLEGEVETSAFALEQAGEVEDELGKEALQALASSEAEDVKGANGVRRFISNLNISSPVCHIGFFVSVVANTRNALFVYALLYASL